MRSSHWDFAVALFGLVLAFVCMFLTLPLPRGERGFLTAICVLIVLSSGGIALRSLKGRSWRDMVPGKETIRVAVIAAVLGLYSLSVGSLGYVLTTFALGLFSLRIFGDSWEDSFFYSAMTTATVFLVFKLFLKVPLPLPSRLF